MDKVLSKILALLTFNLIEKQRQNLSLLQVPIVRDELAALTRKSDHHAKRYTNGNDPANLTMLDQLDTFRF